ncbi:MAG TPA: tRNA pseudouridine(38-40) synthase TruA [Petrotogaceae bacterium]|nr:tRNA pseudouridine(38-40) synthase TruA [Petrotogaceae bacterium]HPX15245.1 tRNA pseudouridine(38-40) synthase TruA [Petrotogaceae bacterium]HQC41224.1 tRNA pseudouridine(38-40) synthase TruA [Petrotogaceae bacterium]HQO11655.1 tRNA pseudouridine(38-40) synthase TruA [Petrotogaceae bacterium]HQP58902.1 tRNA pseudouridine(38-40) synthase TruA [Petrotogaceae bacterium]
MRRVAIKLAYEGTEFFGYQGQRTKRTVQDELEKGLQKIFGFRINTFVAGRTDTGVHAYGQVVAFDVPNDRMTFTNIKDALNSMIPHDMYVKDVWEVPCTFNPRVTAVKRVYHYYIYSAPDPDIFFRNRVWWFPYDLDLSRMRQAAAFFIGEHDYTTFKSGDDERSVIRTVFRVRILRQSNNIILIRVEGKSFLRRMVRNMVGALVKVGTGSWEPQKIRELLELKDRSKSPAAAPPQGLYLYSVLF